jgi:translation initiation factor IF-3|tara:strand:- start:89 stop:634 length:546 start_codon:yes stop_codon:yes gene_type:complete
VSFQKKNYFQKRTRPKGPRANERIRAPQVQVISSDGNNLGTYSTQEAINMAKQEGLDLIEISANANPPVCKIIDIGKYKYDQQKKAHKAKKKQKVMNLKEIKLRPVTEIHDYNFKIKNAQKFLTKGDKVKFTVQFRGREMQHTNLGYELMKRITDDTASLGKIEVKPKFEGRQIIMIIHPL